MEPALSPDEVRQLRRKARLATLDALEALGGQATRQAIKAWVLEHAGFSPQERSALPPEKWRDKHPTRLEYELSWTLTNLKRDGLVANPKRSVWALAGAAAAPDLPLAAPLVSSRIEQLNAMSYREYLRSPEWRETRGAALVRAGHACALDLTHTDRLEVHHRTYDRRGQERPSDVIVLCQGCHRLFHEQLGRPGRRTPPRPSAPPPTFVAAVGSEPPAVQSKQRLLSRLFAR